jgi:hypothetical protein
MTMTTLLQNAKILGVELHDCYDGTDKFYPHGKPIKNEWDRQLVELVYKHRECITMGTTVASFRYSK